MLFSSAIWPCCFPQLSYGILVSLLFSQTLHSYVYILLIKYLLNISKGILLEGAKYDKLLGAQASFSGHLKGLSA